jgi:Zn-dependent metalloprotease
MNIPRILLLLLLSLLLVSLGSSSGNKQVKLSHSKRSTSQWEYNAQGRWEVSSGIARTLHNVNFGPLSGTPEQVAKTYLSLNAQLFQMKSTLEDLTIEKIQESPAGYHVRFSQSFQGIPIYQSDVVVSLNKSNFITFVSNNYKPNLKIEQTIPSLSANDATRLFKNHLNIAGNIYHQSEAALMIYAEQEPSRLVYKVGILTDNPRGDWEGFIDAITGEVVSVHDIAFYDTPRRARTINATGSGLVWNPDPLTSAEMTYGSPGFKDSNDYDFSQLNAERITVTLKNLNFRDGRYHLDGPHVNVEDWDPPWIEVVSETDSTAFRYTRNQSGFEDVMMYYFIDSSQRYMQSLGFFDIQNRPIESDPHGVNGEDNAYFSPSRNAMSFGEGGVDDAEDADVILHEYGHAIQWGIVYGWGGNNGGNEEGAIGEGFGDYWAGSYSRAVNNTFSRNFAFTWDAGFNGTRGTIWPGRPLNFPESYPEGGVGGQEVHDAGRYWSGVLMLIYEDVGREVCDRIVLQSHYYLGTFATMRDNAVAVLQADRDLYGGSHFQQVAFRFAQRNFLPSTKITHKRLGDTENLSGPYSVKITIEVGFFPIATNGISVHWGRNGTISDSSLLTWMLADTFSGSISGNDSPAVYNYYFKVTDSLGFNVFSPPNAPAELYSFYAGTDTIHPAFQHTPLADQARKVWAPTVRVVAHDNIGIDSVWIEFVRQRENLTGSFPLLRQNDSTFSSLFGLDTSQIIIGDSIFYNVFVKDSSSQGNITRGPSSGSYAFKISRLKILVAHQVSSSLRLFYNTLKTMPFDVDSMKWSTSQSEDIAEHNLIILTGGVNPSPLFIRRTELANWVAQGGKIWVEGGNVGYLYRHNGSQDFDPIFRREILHTDAWLSDAIYSTIDLLEPSHRFFTTPNLITSPIYTETYTETGDRDAMVLLSGTGVRRLAQMTEHTNSAAIIVYTPPSSATPSTVFTTFALSSLQDTIVARQLIENIVTAFFPDEGTVGVNDEKVRLPENSALIQNYPNPFNPKTLIHYQLSANSIVTLKIFNLLGQEVATVVDGKRDAGSYSIEFDAATLSSGVYFYRLEAIPVNDPAQMFVQTRKMVVVK